MTAERDEAQLRQLFDRTALEASGATLTKLKARAADVPEAAPSRAWRRWLLPALAFAGGAALTAVILRTPDAAEPVATATPGQVVAAVEASTSTPLEEVVANTEFDDDLNGLAHLTGDVDSDVAMWADLAPASDDADLELWLSATESFLEEGG